MIELLVSFTSLLGLITCIAAVIFSFKTIYETNKIKRMNEERISQLQGTDIFNIMQNYEQSKETPNLLESTNTTKREEIWKYIFTNYLEIGLTDIDYCIMCALRSGKYVCFQSPIHRLDFEYEYAGIYESFECNILSIDELRDSASTQNIMLIAF